MKPQQSSIIVREHTNFVIHVLSVIAVIMPIMDAVIRKDAVIIHNVNRLSSSLGYHDALKTLKDAVFEVFAPVIIRIAIICRTTLNNFQTIFLVYIF